jgi:SAM-dependent methyltransferase
MTAAQPLSHQPVSELSETCIACGSGRIRARHDVPEAMFRTGEHFTYRECGACGSLQIGEVPPDLGAYYDPGRYYSFAGPDGKLGSRWLRTPPARAALRLNTALYLRAGLGQGQAWARRAGIRPRDRILDIGCGDGTDLLRLHLLGYRHLAGADPFLSADTEAAPGVPLLKAGHAELEGRFEWVMMHHSFEHVADPRALLASVRRLLCGDGRLLVRMPVAGGRAWRDYGTDWVQLDAPRHLAVYTAGGFRRLARECGYRVEDVFCDSWAFQFWGSELVRAGEAHAPGPGDRFTPQQMAAWAAEARRLNRALDGDQAGFVLRPTVPRSSKPR